MIRSWINNMRRSQSGSALPMVALGIFVLTGAAGSAIDMGRVQMVQAKLSNSLDAAGLAVGSEASSVDVNLESLKYFNVNYPTNFLGSTVHDYSVATNTNNEIITLSVKADVPTLFMQLFGIPKITVSAASQITRQSSGMELVLVLDNTDEQRR
jgi:Flp pilus assembly protein TadG